MRPSTTILLYFLATTSGMAYVLVSSGALQQARNKSPGDLGKVVEMFARSELALFILLNWLFAAMSTFVLLTTLLFLGHLSARESALLVDRLVKFCAFKLMFVSALKLPPSFQETVDWLAWFAGAGFLRIFVGMARDRLEALMASTSAPASAHIRAVSLVLLILIRDGLAIRELWASRGTGSVAAVLGFQGVPTLVALLGGRVTAAAASVTTAAESTGAPLPPTGPRSVSRIVLCAYDLAIIMFEGAKALLKYGVHLADVWAARRAAMAASAAHGGHGAPPYSAATAAALAAAGGARTPWEGKGGLLFHVELVADVLMHLTTIAHFLHMWALHGCSLHMVDLVLLMDVRAVAVSLYRRLKQYGEYRLATHRLHHAFPSVYPPADEPCSICFEPMQVAKQLPCGHVFHLACLRAWLQQSGAGTFTCPNCRQPLLVEPPSAYRLPGPLERLRNYAHLQINRAALYMLRLLLELDQRAAQRQLAAQLAARGAARGGSVHARAGALPAHAHPEGSGESPHPAPVSWAQKLVRRLLGARRRRGAATPSVAPTALLAPAHPATRWLPRWLPRWQPSNSGAPQPAAAAAALLAGNSARRARWAQHFPAASSGQPDAVAALLEVIAEEAHEAMLGSDLAASTDSLDDEHHDDDDGLTSSGITGERDAGSDSDGGATSCALIDGSR